MAEFVKIARCDEVAEGSGKVVEVNGRKIALFNAGGQFYAIANECRHLGAPLGEGIVSGTRVVCPLHGWEYDFTTGCNVDDPSITLRCFAVKVAAGDVLIEA
jgi:nitrite reductase/ring-hydroxylating ferredoxin subunit